MIQEPTPIERQNIPFQQGKATAMSRFFGMGALVVLFGVGAGLSWFYLNIQQAGASARQVAAAATTTKSPEPQASAFASTTVIAESAIVIDLGDSKILYQKNATAQLPLASLTKVPMAYVVSQSLSRDSVIKIPYDTVPAGGVTQFIKGEQWKTQDVIDLTLVASSNDGAEILAAAANDALHSQYPQSPVGRATVWRMNDLARELHLSNTYFINPSGLDESATQAGAYGSARDMARLFAYVASSSPDTFAATKHARVQRTSLDGREATAVNTDLALDAIPGVIMGKTGYTDLAGGNLVVVFNVEEHHPVVIAVLHSTEEGRFEDMKQLVAATQEIYTQASTTKISAANGIQ